MDPATPGDMISLTGVDFEGSGTVLIRPDLIASIQEMYWPPEVTGKDRKHVSTVVRVVGCSHSIVKETAAEIQAKMREAAAMAVNAAS